MDLRQIKTRASIRSAFLEIRGQKPLEKITVKEVAEKAMISKATFYLHYSDIRDLSDTLQRDAIQRLLAPLKTPQDILDYPEQAMQSIFCAFSENRELIDTLFADNQAPHLPVKLEHGIRSYLFSELPQLEADLDVNVYLSYQIQGSFYAYLANQGRFTRDQVAECINRMVGCTRLEDTAAFSRAAVLDAVEV